MTKNLVFKTLSIIASFLISLIASAQSNPADWVNPLVGTQSSYELSHGNTYPAIAMPWGMNTWTPQTGKMGNGWQYTYDAHKIRGFKQTHQPSPWINDYGQFSIMPMVGSHPQFDEEARASWFSHKTEVVKPYYYSVYLADYNLKAEITPSERGAAFRFTYPHSGVEAGFITSWLVIDAFDGESEILAQEGSFTISGYSSKNSGGVPENFKCYFTIELDRPIAEVQLDEVITEKGLPHKRMAIRLDTKKNSVVQVRVASSFISPEQAQINLHEVRGYAFESLMEKGRKRWNDLLGRIIVEGGSTDETKTFYSALYRCLLFPRRFYEIDAQGKIIHYSPYSGEVLPGYLYTDTGFWDTFRALFPLLNLIYPDENIKIQEGLLNTYRESGFFPEWASPGHRDCMIGNHSASVLADAFIKGIKVTDLKTLSEGVIHGANHVHPEIKSVGRIGFEYYNKLGYVPYNVKINESVARSLEYSYDDWCIYRLLKAMGRPEKEWEPFATRSLNYRILFDPTSNLMRPRLKNGRWVEPFDPFKWGDAYTEGNAWHYVWSCLHDIQGLINLLGGEGIFTEMLDLVFNLPPIFNDSYYGHTIHEIREMQIVGMGNYAHGNQPMQHMAYLYNYASEPWKAQMRIRDIMKKLYQPTPDGYCGDEDNGQTSAWYVFSAMGFYPVCPGTDQYVIGSPLFKRITLYPQGGLPTSIVAQGNNAATPYIQEMTLNGVASTKCYLTHQELRGGSQINFVMSSKANEDRGIEMRDRPYSFSKEEN